MSPDNQRGRSEAVNVGLCSPGLIGAVEGVPEPVKAFETSAQDFFCASFSMLGLLIHAAVGSLGGLGRRFPKRHGLAA